MTFNSLTENEEHGIPAQTLKTIFELNASVIFGYVTKYFNNIISTGYFQQWIKGIWTERYTTNDIWCSNKCVPISPDIVCGIITKSEISQSLEAARFAFRIVRSPWNLTGTSAAQLPKCLSNLKAIRIFQQPILNLRDFARSHDKTSYRILKRGLGTVISIMIFVQTLLYTSNNCDWKRRIGQIQFI